MINKLAMQTAEQGFKVSEVLGFGSGIFCSCFGFCWGGGGEGVV